MVRNRLMERNRRKNGEGGGEGCYNAPAKSLKKVLGPCRPQKTSRVKKGLEKKKKKKKKKKW